MNWGLIGALSASCALAGAMWAVSPWFLAGFAVASAIQLAVDSWVGR